MKKGLLALLIVVLSIFIPIVNAEQLDVLFKMDPEVKDNTFTIQLGFREAKTMAIMSNIVYNQDKLEFVSIDANEYFHVSKSNDKTNGSFKSFTILADSEYAFEKVYYANITFKIKDALKKGDRTDIYFNNNKSATADEIMVSSPSMVYTLFYDKEGSVSYVASERNFMTSLNIYLTNNWHKVLIALFIIFGLLIALKYWIVVKDIKLFKKKHNHNHIVEEMKFAKVPVNLQTVDVGDKPDKIRIAKLGKWGKKKVDKKEEPKKETDISKLMADDIVEEVKEDNPERGLFIGNKNTGNDNELPDDFSSFGKSSNSYAYDDDQIEDNDTNTDGANLDDLSNISLTDEDDNKGSKIGIFLALLMLFGLFNIKPVNALNEEEMDNLRSMILGDLTWNAEYDINNDNSIDMLDLIALKDINNITIIKDSINVEESKDNNFVVKSTSQYVRTTVQGQTKRTTADGKWKNTESNNKPSNNDNDIEDPITEPIVKIPESRDLTDGSEDNKNITINYTNGSGDYSEIKIKSGEDVSFDIYPKGEGYQNISVNMSNGNYKITGEYPAYHINLFDITSDSNVNISFNISNSINAKINTGLEIYEFNKKTPGEYIEKNIEYDNHYEVLGINCNGGFIDYNLTGNKFTGKIAESSGSCILKLKAKYYSNSIKYNGITITTYSGNYGETVNNVSLFDTSIKSDKYNLYCGNVKITPKNVELTKEVLNGISFEGYRYIFDVKVTGLDCDLK